MMKPAPEIAMQNLIDQLKTVIPFDLSEAQLCAGGCKGCSKKLLAFLEMEIDGWESRLENGDIPSFGEINALAKTGKKIYAALNKSGLLKVN